MLIPNVELEREKNKEGKICEKYLTWKAPSHEARWNNKNQQWIQELRTLCSKQGDIEEGLYRQMWNDGTACDDPEAMRISPRKF